MEAVSLFATGWIRSGRDPGSPGLSDLSGSPSVNRTPPASLWPGYLPGVGWPRPSRNGLASPSRPSQLTARHLPFRDAGLPGLPAMLPSRSFRTGHPPRTIFSSRRPPTPCEAGSPSLCGRCQLSYRKSVNRFGISLGVKTLYSTGRIHMPPLKGVIELSTAEWLPEVMVALSECA
jgi:hypothetical protein